MRVGTRVTFVHFPLGHPEGKRELGFVRETTPENGGMVLVELDRAEPDDIPLTVLLRRDHKTLKELV